MIVQPENITNPTPTEKEGLFFKVEVAAPRVQMDHADPRFIGLEVEEEYRHQRLYKYSLGSFRSFEEVKQLKNVLRFQGLTDSLQYRSAILKNLRRSRGELFYISGLKIFRELEGYHWEIKWSFSLSID